MAIQAVGLAAAAALEAAEVLRAGGQIALGGGAQYLRDGQPIGVVAKLGQELARVACRRYGSDPSSYPSDTALNYERACRPYLEDIGEGSGPGIELPFRGGQCVANYQISGTFQTYGGANCAVNAGSTPFNAFLNGPIKRIYYTNGNNNPPSCSQSPGRLLRAEGVDNDIGLASSGAGGLVRVTNITISRAGGLPDDCGNPTPEVVQPQPPVIVLPPIVPIIIAPDINVDAEVEVNLDGSINIDIGTGDITIDPFGDNSDGGDGGGGGADDSPPNPEPGPELPGGNGGFGGDDLFGEPPAGRRWVGCCIRITARPTNQPPIPGTVPEDVYASVVGNIRLVYDASGSRQTDTPVRIQARKVCVWEAVRKLNPVGVSVDLQPGFGYVYRPYSVPLDA